MSAAAPRSGAGGVLVLVALLALLAGAAWWVFGGGPRPLARSALGHDGLVAWLRAEGLPAERARGLPMTPARIGLRILPLHDTDLAAPFEPPAERRAWLATGTERDIPRATVARKIARAPTLLVAPKWSRAMRHAGIAHESLLLPLREASRPLRQLGLIEADLRRPSAGLAEVALPEGAATLYAAQLFAPELPPGCRSRAGGARGHLLLSCRRDGRAVWLLSDPDLLNNHGLSLGANARTAAALLPALAGEGAIVLDPTTRVFVTEPPRPDETRSWSDLARFFAFPFSLLWAGAGATLALLLWRGGVRVAPPVRLFAEGPGASKTVSIAAKARLLRRTGHPLPVLQAHAEARLRWLDRELHGREGGEDPVCHIRARVARQDPARAEAFARAAAAIQTAPRTASPAALTALAATLEEEIQQVLDESGRPRRRR